MVEPYRVLGVESTASLQEIKASYQRLVLQHHPDKKLQQGGGGGGDDDVDAFLRIQQAWEILGDVERRAEHDKRAMRQSQAGFICESLPLSEFETIGGGAADADADADGGPWYSKACRCGDVFEVSRQDLEEGHNTVQCNGCSLYVKVIAAE